MFSVNGPVKFVQPGGAEALVNPHAVAAVFAKEGSKTKTVLCIGGTTLVVLLPLKETLEVLGWNEPDGETVAAETAPTKAPPVSKASSSLKPSKEKESADFDDMA